MIGRIGTALPWRPTHRNLPNSAKAKETHPVKLPPVFRIVTAGLASTVLLAGCGGGSAPAGPAVAGSGWECPEPSPRLEVTSESLTLFVWTEYVPNDIIDCFEQVYDVKVNRDEYSSNEEMYAKLSQGASNFDLAQPTDNFLGLMIRTDLLQPIDPAKLPNLKNIGEGFFPVHGDSDGGYAVPYMAGTQAIVYNSDTVTAPTSWADLWKPEYAGRMVFIDDARVIIGMALLTAGHDINSTNPDEINGAKPRVQELVDAVRIFDSDSPKTALIAGDAELGMVWTAEAVLAKRENPAFTYVYPSEGQVNFADAYVLLKDAPHADAAYAWLNYSLQGDVFWKMLEEFPYTMPNQAALDYARDNAPELYEEYMNSPATNTPPEIWAQGHWIEDVGEATTLYETLWTEVKGR
jgi:spermidine/putrescine-binding protein